MSEEAANSTNDCEPKRPLFRDLDPDEADPEATEIESLCVSCQLSGTTKLLLTRIPHYKEVVVMSFSCPHCHYSNNELQSAGAVQERGVRYKLTVSSPSDLNRQVVKSDYTSVRIPEVDLEIPARSQKGEVTTVEGVVDRAVEGLQQDQARRREDHPEVAFQLDQFIQRLQRLKHLDSPFTLVIEDISGNSWVENPVAPGVDPGCETTCFTRRREDDHALGLYTEEEIGGPGEEGEGPAAPTEQGEEPRASDGILPGRRESFTYEDLEGEVLQFQTNCPSCCSPCPTNMKLTSIPYFKEVVIMATNCDVCGHRTNEVKSSGGIEETGIRIQVSILDKQDLSRDILKSETCHVRVPEAGLDVGPTTLGGRFTTVEGLLSTVRDQLFTQSTIFSDTRPERQETFQRFLDKLDALVSGRKPFTLLLDDPAGNSYVQSLTAPEPDPNLTVERYERSFEENEDLGLNDIKTENYSEDT